MQVSFYLNTKKSLISLNILVKYNLVQAVSDINNKSLSITSISLYFIYNQSVNMQILNINQKH